jgi:predicted site-specific integrase-resolvase
MFSTIEAANSIGVSKNTLLRWLDEGLVDDVQYKSIQIGIS